MKAVMPYFESSIDTCCESTHMQFIKDCFWENKKRDYYQNDKINVAIHIRRENTHDKGQAGERATTPNGYYLYIMNTYIFYYFYPYLFRYHYLKRVAMNILDKVK